jgi:hypothetical protein
MIESQQRVEEFRREVADMRLRDPATARDRNLLRVGVLMMIAGIVLTVVGYLGSHGAEAAYNTQGPAEQRDYIVVAIMGLAVSVVGAALFLRYSLANFMRFWLARLVYEQQAQTDRIVGAARPGDVAEPAGAVGEPSGVR